MPSLPRSFVWLFVAVCGVQPAPAQEPAAPETMVVEGRVVDMRGEGVPAAKVWVTTWGEPHTVLARGGADGDGFFRIGKVPKLENLQVRAASEGYCTGVEYLGNGSVATVHLQSATTVRGTLRDRAGKPVPNTTVCARVHGRVLDYVMVLAKTDAEGRFELAAVPLAPIHLAAWIPGDGLAQTMLHMARAMDLELRPDATPTTRLVVQIDGVPADALGDITLSLLPYVDGSLRELPPPLNHLRPSAAESVLDAMPDCEYRVSPSSTKWAFAPRERKAEPGKGPHVLKFTGTPRRDSKLACPIVVTGPDGKPAAGVTFVMRASNGGNRSRGTTDADGKLTLESPLGIGTEAILYSVDERWVTDQEKIARANRYLDPRDLNDHEFVVDPSKPVEVRLAPASSVAGRLLRADGRPAAFVSVELEESRPNRMPLWMGLAYATTDRDGNYRFPGLHHIAAPLRVHSASVLGEWAGEPFDLSKPGTVVKLPDAKLGEPATVEGVLRDAQQQPVGGVRVWLRDWDMVRGSQSSGSLVETLTDAQGRYRFLGVPLGGAWLQLLAEPGERNAWEKAVEPFEVEAGKTYTFDLQLPDAK
ncbi:MAG: carboxypeptidase regulatory-like domain-containing protein [Planctomycetes bacterium]|nr:carboxypeptidase regulatory-like domain-containing protein [Planctomycetota bacterium]